MEQEPTTTDAPPLEERPKKIRIRTSELTRASTDRIIAGVAQGVARRTGLWSGWIRAAFVLLAFAGGLGIAVYVIAWVLIRADNEPDTIAQRFFARTTTTGSWVGVALIFIAIVILLENVSFLSSEMIWAVGLLTIGFLLYTGDLPRLIKESSRPKEGVQQLTTADVAAHEAHQEPVGGEDIATPPPPPPTPTPPILPASPPREKSILGRLTFGVMAIALAVLAILDNTTNLVDPSPRHYIALAVTVLGVGLCVGALAGRARWLILIGVLAMPLLLGSPALEYDLAELNSGTVFVIPDTVDAVPQHVSEGVGEVVIDLRDVPWSGQHVSLDAFLDVGEMYIYVPEDVAIRGVAEGSIGQVRFENDRSAGFNPDLRIDVGGSRGTLNLYAIVRVGNLEILRLPIEDQEQS